MGSEFLAQFRFGDLLSEPIRNGVYKPKEFHGRGCKIVNMGELFAHPRLFAVPMKRLELNEREMGKSLLQTGDLLFARRSLVAEGAGKCSIVKAISEPTTFESSIIRARPDQSKALSEYLYYFFSSPVGRERIGQILRQVAVSGIAGSDLVGVLVDLPKLEEQVEIVRFLGAIDDKIALLRETNATLEALAQAIFKSWFVDFDPVRAKAEGRDPEGVPPEVADLFPSEFEDSPLGAIPKGWRVQQLGLQLEVLETGRRPKGGVGDIREGVPSIGAESIIRVGQFDYTKTKYVSWDFFHAMSSGKLESRDVLLYKDGGKPGIFLPRVSMFGDGYPFEVCGINEHVFRIRSRDTLSQPFLYFWLWSDIAMHELKHRGGKAAIPGINQSDVREVPVIVPNKAVLGEFSNIADSLITKILANATHIQSLSDVRDTLLPRLMSGKLRIPGVEEVTA